MTATRYFTPASLNFLKELAANNHREWFNAHKKTYETALRDPYLQLIADLAAPLATISPHFVADPRPVGGSLFRLYRDTRFAKDKTPYKTWAGAKFFHERSRELSGDVPVFYLHVEPGSSFVGGGLWHPQAEAVRRVRDYMLNNPASWKAATRSPEFIATYRLGGEALSRPPRGYDAQHELIGDLKRKDFVAAADLDDTVLTSSALLEQLVAHYQRVTPLVDWLCGALDLEF